MVTPERFVNFTTSNPTALKDTVGSDFQASGTNHAKGLVPDPGSTPGTTKFLREDATWQAITTSSVLPSPTRAGDLIYWNGSSWITLAGNNSGTQLLQENSSGVPSWATISNFTSGTAGLVPASGGGTVNFLRADGSFVPAGRVLLNTLTANNSAAFVEDTTSFTGTFDDYEIVFDGLSPASTSFISGQLYTNSVLQTANYLYAYSIANTATPAASSTNNVTAAAFAISPFSVIASSAGLSGSLRIFNANSSTLKLMTFHIAALTGQATPHAAAMGMAYYSGDTNAITGLRILGGALSPTVNLASGKVKIFGLT